MRLFGYLGLGTVVFIVLFTLRLTKYIMWSWWWVFAPLWLPVLIPILVMIGTTIWIIYKYWLNELKTK